MIKHRNKLTCSTLTLCSSILLILIVQLHAFEFYGDVVDTNNNPITSAVIDLYYPESGAPAYSVKAAANGSFNFPDIVESDYQILVKVSGYPDQWFHHNTQNTVHRQYITRIGVATTTLPFVIKVVDTPIKNLPDNTITVTVSSQSGVPSLFFNGIGLTLLRREDNVLFSEGFITDGTATLTFDSLSQSEYAIRITRASYLTQWYNPAVNTTFPSHFISVSGGTTHSETVYLYDPPKGDAHLTVQVLSESDMPAAGIAVSLWEPRDTLKKQFYLESTTSGYCHFDSIPDREYYLKLSSGSYPEQWYTESRNSTTRNAEEMVSPMHYANDTLVVRVQTDPIDNSMAGSVYFNVSNPDGNATDGGTITLISAVDNTPYTAGYESATGYYTSYDIPMGNYQVKIDFPSYPVQYYTPTGNITNPEYNIFVSQGDDSYYYPSLTSSPETSIASNYSSLLTGVLKDPEGNPLPDVFVNVFNADGLVQSITTMDDGTIPFTRIPAQNLAIEFQHLNFPVQYLSSNGTGTTFYSEEWISVSANDTLLIDEVLHHDTSFIQGNNTFTGTVNDAATSSPLANVRVVAFDYDPGDHFNTKHVQSPWSTTTNTDGTYTIDNIPGGSFYIMAEAESVGYVVQFFPGGDHPSQATRYSFTDAFESHSADFSLRKGGTLKGPVVDMNGNPIPGAYIHCINRENTRWCETMSDAGGIWRISGLPKGEWDVWADHDNYIVHNDTVYRTYSVTEGSITSVHQYVMQPGSHLTGTFTSAVSLYDTSMGHSLMEGDISFFEPGTHTFMWPQYTTGINFTPTTSAGVTGTFSTHSTLPGEFYVCYTPRTDGGDPNATSNYALLPGTGFSLFPSNSYTFPEPVRLTAGDTTNIANVPFTLPKGFNIFGTVKNEEGILLTSNYGIEVFVKRGETYFRITNGHPIGNERFEIPGLVDNEDYYFQIQAEGYPQQFWSPTGGNTFEHATPFRFNSAVYQQLTIPIVRKPEGIPPDQIQGPISLWIDPVSTTPESPVLRWKCDPSFAMNTFQIFRMNRFETPVEITTVSASATYNSTEYTYQDVTQGTNYREYIIVGNGTSVVRSDPVAYNPKTYTDTSSLWLNVFSSRYGIELEWGLGEHNDFTENDSIFVYRKSNTEPERLLYTQMAWNTFFDDHDWDQSDLGVTYTYRIEFPVKNLSSPAVSFTLTDAFFKGLPETFMVGPYEKYQRIADAVAAASDYDRIEIRSGTYKENISTGGKILFIEGAWDYGTPPVIDGGGGTALTIPFSDRIGNRERPRVSGIAFRNCATAIKSYSQIEVEGCLFDNVSLGVSMAIDEDGMTDAMRNNPFIFSSNDAWIGHCTFIAQNSGNMIAAVTATGKAEVDGYTGEYQGLERFYLEPLVSLRSSAHIERSSICFYGTLGNQTYFPVSVQGNTSSIRCERSNLYKTVQHPSSGTIFVENDITTHDPLFTDSTLWFVADSSPLRGESWDSFIGYDVRRFDFYGDSDENRPSSVKNLHTAQVGLSTIFIRWDASPAEEKVKGYNIYRIPGDPSLFYINQKSQWDVKIPEDSLLSLMKTFSSTSTAFLDTTAQIGKTYLYVVAAVNSEGHDGEIELPAPPDIATYFTRTIPLPKQIPANTWQLVGWCGAQSQQVNYDTSHIVYGWDNTRASDKLYANYVKSPSATSGSGYWVKSLTTTQLNANLSSVSALATNDEAASLDIVKGTTGWNLVSSPYPFSITPDWIANVPLWEWNADSIGYRKASSIEPWKGYWVYTEQDTSLRILKKPTLKDLLTARLAKKAAPTNLWQLTVALQQGKSFDTDNSIGAVNASLAKKMTTSILKPPMAFDGARLYIIDNSIKDHSGTPQRTSLAQLNKAVSPTTRTLDWQIGISASASPSIITVDNIASLPKDWHLFWIQKERIVALTVNDNTLTLTPSDQEHFGIITATSDLSSLNRFTGKLALRAPNNPNRRMVTVSYTLPYSWQNGLPSTGGNALPVTLTLFDLAGRKVTTILNSRKVPGEYRVLWNGTNSSGNLVANGVYFLKLQYAGQQKTARLFRVN